MKELSVLLTIMLFINACSSPKNWNGTATVKGTKATFSELNGRQAFKMIAPNCDTYLKYNFDITNGRVKAVMKSSDEVVFDKEINAAVLDSIHLVNQKGTEYKILITGKQASGKFDVYFTNGAN